MAKVYNKTKHALIISNPNDPRQSFSIDGGGESDLTDEQNSWISDDQREKHLSDEPEKDDR